MSSGAPTSDGMDRAPDFDRERVEGDLSQLAAARAVGIRRDLEEI